MVDYDTRDRLVTSSVAVEPLSVGRVLSDCKIVLGRAWLSLYGLSLVAAIASLPFALIYSQKLPGVLRAARNTAGTSAAVPDSSFWVQAGLLYALQIIVTVLVFGASAACAYRALGDERAGLAPALKTGLARALPMIVAALAFYIVLVLGLALFVVPGLIFGAAFGLAPTLCVVERRGPFESFSRSADLTRGNRWRCLAVTLILTLVPGIVVAVLNALSGRIVGPQNTLLVGVVTNFFVLPIYNVFPAVLAYDLRRIEEGGAPSGVVAVF